MNIIIIQIFECDHELILLCLTFTVSIILTVRLIGNHTHFCIWENCMHNSQNCTRLCLVQLCRLLLVQLFPNCTQMCAIREYGSTLYVGLARAISPTNTNFWLTFLLTRLQEALYEDLAV